MNNPKSLLQQKKDILKRLAFIKNVNRYELLSRSIFCQQDAKHFKHYQDEEQRQRIIQAFQEIQNTNTVNQHDEMLISLHKLVYTSIKSSSCLNPYLHPSFLKLVDLVLQKKQEIKPEDIETLEFDSITKSKIKGLINSSKFKEWCLKFKDVAPKHEIQQTQMEEEPNNQQTKQIEEKIINMSRSQNAEIQKREKIKLEKRLQDIKISFPGCQNAIIILLTYMHILLSNGSQMLDEIQSKLRQIGSFTSYLRVYFEKISNGYKFRLIGYQGYKIIYEAFKLLLPIDCFQLLQRCQESKFKGQTKNTLIVIGNSGNGKTTLILSFLGYVLNKILCNSGQQLQVQGLKEQHSSLITNNHTESVTTHLSSYRTNSKIGEFSIVDSPGFIDSKGSLVDITNQVNLQNVYKNCKNICYLLLVDTASLTLSKGQGIKKLAQSILNRFQYSNLDELKQFLLIVFNDKHKTIDKDRIGMIRNDIEELISQHQARQNIKYVVALKHILNSIGNSPSDANHYNPLNPQSISMIRQMAFELKYTECRKMKSQFESKTLQDIENCCKYLVKYIRDHEQKNQSGNVRFYYTLINILYSIIPDFIKRTKDQVDRVLQINSERVYNKLVSMLNQKISQNFQCEQNWFDELNKVVSQLLSFNEIAKENKSIKSQKELQVFIHQYENKLKEILNKEVVPSKIQAYCRFYGKFFKVFSPYLNYFYQTIEKQCYESLKKVQSELVSNFTHLKMKSFDKNMEKYEILSLFYRFFAKQSSIFTKTEQISSKELILQNYKEQVKNLSSTIAAQVKQHIQSLMNPAINNSLSLEQSQKLLQRYQRYTESQQLNCKEEYFTFCQKIFSYLSEEYSKIQRKFQFFFEESHPTEQKRANLFGSILKIKQVSLRTNNADFKQKIEKLMTKLQEIFGSSYENVLQKLKRLEQCLKSKNLGKIDDCLGVKQKVNNLKIFEQFFSLSSQVKISKEYQKIMSQIKSIEQFLFDRLFDTQQNIDLSQVLTLFRVYDHVTCGNPQFDEKLKQVQDQLYKIVHTRSELVTETFMNTKIDKVSELKKKLNKTLMKLLLNYINNVYNPFVNQGKLLQDQRYKCIFQEVEKSVHRFFSEIQQVINKEVKFPSQIRQRLLSEQKNHQEIVQKVNEYVDSLTYTHKFIREDIKQNQKLVKYLQKNITLNELNKIAEQVFVERLKKIKQCVSRIPISKYNIQIFYCLQKQVQALKSLEYELKQNDQLDRASKMDEINDQIRQKIANISEKQSQQFQNLIKNKITHYQVHKLVVIYFEVRNNPQNPIYHRIREFLMSQYLRAKQIQINKAPYTQYDLEQTRKINGQFLLLVYQLIILTKEFIIKLGESRDEFQTQFISNIGGILIEMIKKLKQQAQSLKVRTQKALHQGRYIETEKTLDKLKKILRIFQDAKPYINDEQQVKSLESYSTQMKNLKYSLNNCRSLQNQIIQKKSYQFDDIKQLQTIFHNISGQKKDYLTKRIRDFVNREIKLCSEGTFTQRKKKLDRFQDSIWGLPNEININLKIDQRIKDVRKEIQDMQKKFLLDLQNLNLHDSHSKQKIINGFHQLQTCSQKRKILQPIKIYLQKVIKTILSEVEIKKKIEFYEAQVGPFYLYLEERSSEIIKMVSQFEKNFLTMIKSLFTLECQSFISLLESKRITEQNAVHLNIQKIFIIFKYFDTKGKVFYNQEQLNQVNNLFNMFKNEIFNFEKYCPIRLYKKEQNMPKKIQILKKVLQKIHIYKIFLATLFKQDDSGAIDCDSQMIQQNIIMDNEQSKSKHEFYQISEQIDEFERELNTKIKNSLRQIKNFSFEMAANQQDNLQNQIQSKVKLLIQKLQYIEELSINLVEYPDFDEIRKQRVIELQKQLNNKLRMTVQRKLQELTSYIQSAQQQRKPKDFGYVRILISKLLENNVYFLRIYEQGNRQQRRSVKTIIQQKITNLREDLSQKLLTINQQIDSFYQKTIPSKQQELKTIRSQKYVYTEEMKQKISLRLQQIREQNQNQDQQVIQSKIKQDTYILNNQMKENKEKFEEQEKQITEFIQSASQNLLSQFCMQLIQLMKLHQSLDYFTQEQKNIKQLIVQSLSRIEKLNLLKEVSKEFSKIQNFDSIIHNIKSLSKMSQLQAQNAYKQSTLSQDIDYTLNRLQTKQQYLSSQDYFYQEYEGFDRKQLKQNYEYLMGIFQDIKNSGKETKEIIESISISDHLQQLAVILAVYSIQKTLRGKNNEILCDFVPHPVQIVTLILLVSRKRLTNEIQSKLAQVKTGQGKSIILATLAIYYARMKLKVQVACYSKYLSKRDFLQFQSLFKQFKVSDKIFYGTFNQICQLYLQNNKQSLKDITKRYLSQNTQQKSLFEKIGVSGRKIGGVINDIGKMLSGFFTRAKQQKSILLIDQVDVLFESEYLGEIFRPVVKFDADQFKEFIKYVYQLGKTNKSIKPEHLLNSQPYRICISKYPKIESLLKMQVYGIIQGLYNKSPKVYEIHNNEIKYKDKDLLSANLHYGYQTIFANCRQYEAGRISHTNYQKNIFIPLIIGELSYSELPRNSIIQGLSGTIASLPQSKDKILSNKYNISLKNIFICPSIFGDNNNKQPQFHLTDDSTFYKQIVSSIKNIIEKERPVVICFQTYRQLKKFQRSPEFSALQINCNYLHQLQNSEMRDKAVKGAGCKRTVTLMTSQFSRGTDFLVVDRRVKKAGGLALIQAYIPRSYSQFQQFKGRTGRQGDNGSIDVFFNSSQFYQTCRSQELIGLCPVANKPQMVMDSFFTYWQVLDEREANVKQKQLQESARKHEKFIKIVQNMGKAEQQKEFITYIEELNKFDLSSHKKFNIILGIDGTGSMRIAFEKLKAVLKNILKRIQEIKCDLEIRAQFQLRIAVYRNYSSGQRILETSEAQSSPQKLIDFLSDIQVRGGQGNQAIEVLYRYINSSQVKFDMLILMGDAPPNQRQEVRNKRVYRKPKQINQVWQNYQKSQSYNRQFFDIVSSQEQIQKFKKQFVIHGLSINTKQVNCNAKFDRYLQLITNKFNGQSKKLNFGQQNAESEFVKFITTKIACLINDSKDTALIEQTYKNKYQQKVYV